MDSSTVEDQLRAVLTDLLSQSEAGVDPGQGALESTRKLSELGVNSVDLMEFVILAEQKFEVDLLGNLLPDELPETIAEWATFVQTQQSHN